MAKLELSRSGAKHGSVRVLKNLPRESAFFSPSPGKIVALSCGPIREILQEREISELLNHPRQSEERRWR